MSTLLLALLPLGEGTMDHEFPFQCSIRVGPLLPTAQQSEADEHATALSTLLLGEVTIDQPGPVGASGAVADEAFIPLGGVAAKLSIASSTPTEQRVKATKMRGLK